MARPFSWWCSTRIPISLSCWTIPNVWKVPWWIVNIINLAWLNLKIIRKMSKLSKQKNFLKIIRSKKGRNAWEERFLLKLQFSHTTEAIPLVPEQVLEGFALLNSSSQLPWKRGASWVPHNHQVQHLVFCWDLNPTSWL